MRLHAHTHTHTQGYLQMKLPHRLRYILEVCRPPSNITVLILEILTRLCRHSVLTASKVSCVMMNIPPLPPLLAFSSSFPPPTVPFFLSYDSVQHSVTFLSDLFVDSSSVAGAPLSKTDDCCIRGVSPSCME